VKNLSHEKAMLEEESERYRRQLGGRYGADGQLQNQLDKLNKELMDAHHENQNLKRRLAQSASQDASLSFQVDNSHMMGNYSSGVATQSALADIKAGYEERVTSLNEEKRELVMKFSAATIEVDKANKQLHQREELISKLKSELTTTKLALERAQLQMGSAASDENTDSYFYSPGNDRDVESPYYSQGRDTSYTAQGRDDSFSAQAKRAPIMAK
jgi:chromosome segregation ATPase